MISAVRVGCLFKGLLKSVPRVLSMAADKLASVPEVEIDPEGTFKYILIKVYGPESPKGSEPVKTIVRGFKWGNYHGDIYDKTLAKVQQLGLDSECVGGGRIQHDSANKTLKVYGYSQGFGKADHEVTVALLKKFYPSYNITCSDEGY